MNLRDGGNTRGGGREHDGGSTRDGGREHDGGSTRGGGRERDGGSTRDGGREHDGGRARDGGREHDGGRARDGGSTLVVAMLGTVAVLAVAGLAVLSVRGQSVTLGRDRALRVAQYAAEGGVHVAAEFLSRRCNASDGFTDIIASDTANDLTVAYGNDVGADAVATCADGTAPIAGECTSEPWFTEDGNLGAEPDGTADLEYDLDVSYDVNFFDNDDGDNNEFLDADDTVVVRSTGYGPNGAQSLIVAVYRSPICTNVQSGCSGAMDGVCMDPPAGPGAFTSDANAYLTAFTADLDVQGMLD